MEKMLGSMPISMKLMSKRKKFLFKYFLYPVIIAFILDIFFLKEIYLGILVGLIISWIILIHINKLKNRYSFSFFFVLVVIWLILMVFKSDSFSEKLNIWVYSFLLIGTIQYLLEEKRGLKKK